MVCRLLQGVRCRAPDRSERQSGVLAHGVICVRKCPDEVRDCRRPHPAEGGRRLPPDTPVLVAEPFHQREHRGIANLPERPHRSPPGHDILALKRESESRHPGFLLRIGRCVRFFPLPASEPVPQSHRYPPYDRPSPMMVGGGGWRITLLIFSRSPGNPSLSRSPARIPGGTLIWDGTASRAPGSGMFSRVAAPDSHARPASGGATPCRGRDREG